jgi:hypothetical protein
MIPQIIKSMAPLKDGAPLGEALRAGSEVSLTLIAVTRTLSIASKIAIFDPYDEF